MGAATFQTSTDVLAVRWICGESMAPPKGYIMEPCPNCGTSPHKPGYAKDRKDAERRAEYEYVLRLRARKMSWREIGEAIGKSHEQARQIGRGL